MPELMRGKISIHAPAKGATNARYGVHWMVQFQFTLPRRERRRTTRRTAYSEDFNSRSREGSDFALLLHTLCSKISIHAPAKGATNRRPFGVCCKVISIHAPAKGATTGDASFNPYYGISIHAPAKGATGGKEVPDVRYADFNSRSREGSDPVQPSRRKSERISIHAPAKGATHMG